MKWLNRNKIPKSLLEQGKDLMKIIAVPDANTGEMRVVTILPKKVCKDGFILMDSGNFESYFKELQSVMKTIEMNRTKTA